MITVERTFVVDRPVSSVYAYLRDFTATEQWDPGTVSTVRTDDGPLQVGSTFRNVSEFRGRRTELDYELKVMDPDRHLVFTGVNKTVEATDDLTFAAASASSTSITYQARFRFRGLARLAEPFLRRGFEPIADETIAQLTATLLERV